MPDALVSDVDLRLTAVKEGTAELPYNLNVAQELASVAVTHNLGFVPGVLAFCYGQDASGLTNKQLYTLAMKPVPFVDWNGTTLAAHIFYSVDSSTVTFYRRNGSAGAGSGQKDLIKFYLLAQHGSAR